MICEDAAMNEWFTDSGTALLSAVISAVAIFAAVIVCCRLQGVRSFAKMSSFDFAITVAFGSIVASTALASDPPLVRGAVVLATLFVAQWAVAKLRVHWRSAEAAVDNRPVMVMRRGVVLDAGLRQASMTRSDLMGKLREANALRKEHVHAVIAESTGDVSVLHGEGDEAWVHDELLDGVRVMDEDHGGQDRDTGSSGDHHEHR